MGVGHIWFGIGEFLSPATSHPTSHLSPSSARDGGDSGLSVLAHRPGHVKSVILLRTSRIRRPPGHLGSAALVAYTSEAQAIRAERPKVNATCVCKKLRHRICIAFPAASRVLTRLVFLDLALLQKVARHAHGRQGRSLQPECFLGMQGRALSELDVDAA